jgi:protocatechuate 4,5-dioxygenase alpha chain
MGCPQRGQPGVWGGAVMPALSAAVGHFDQPRPQPGVGRVVVVAPVPDHEHGQPRARQGQWRGSQPEQRRPAQARRQRGQQPAADHEGSDRGQARRQGYALNKMCYSFNDARPANRDAFLADTPMKMAPAPQSPAYMRQYGLNEPQADAIRSKQVLQLLAAGGNAYYLAKFAGIFGLDMQDIGAQQTGLTKDEFKAKLVVAANQQ